MKREEPSATARSLYERLGGSAGIAAIVDDVIAAHLANPVVAPRYRNVKDMEQLRRVSREFFCAGAGGTEKYTGRDMRTAHQGMNVSEQEFLAVVDDVMGVLGRHRIDDSTQKDVLAILYGFRGEIIRG
jgi:hemoglobin